MNQCYLERRRGMGPNGDRTHFILYSETTLDALVCATSTNEEGTYIFANSETDFTEHGDNYVGIMKSSFTGTHFHLYDYGMEASKAPNEFFGSTADRKSAAKFETHQAPVPQTSTHTYTHTSARGVCVRVCV